MSAFTFERDEPGSGLDRREFLRLSGLAPARLLLPGSDARRRSTEPERAVILLLLVGGPSQLETFDPKPDAPEEIRGPFGSIPTRIPGIRLNEFLPRLARRMDWLTVIRSLFHDEAPIHEAGLQLVQTGRLSPLGLGHPHVGAGLSALKRHDADLPPFVVLPEPLGPTGVGICRGQTAGWLGADHSPVSPSRLPQSGPEGTREVSPGHFHSSRWTTALDVRPEPSRIREAYGPSRLGRDCLRARRLVEAGVRCVVINTRPTVFQQVSWDCHGRGPFSSLDDYRRELLPDFDRAVSGLLDDLGGRGLLDRTLVVATGEFGRTPRINAAGGRDHWPAVWSALMAGGGTRGGVVVGASDRTGAAPTDRPVTPAELVATIYRSAGVDPSRPIVLDDGRSQPLLEGAAPIGEVFG